MTNQEVFERFEICWSGGPLLPDYDSATTLTDATQARASRSSVPLPTVKTCRQCWGVKGTDQFYTQAGNRDGIAGICKRCAVTRQRSYRRSYS